MSRRFLFSVLCGILLLVPGCHSSRPTDELLQESIRLTRRKDFKAAATLLDQLLKQDPEHVDGLLARAQVARDLGQPEEALTFLKRVNHGSESRQAQARFLAANILLEAGNAQLAEEEFLKSISLDSKLAIECHERLLPLYVLQGRSDDIRTQIADLRKTRGLSLAEMSLWITADGRITDPATAVSALKKFLEVDPNDEFSLIGLSQQMTHDGKIEEAITQLKEDLGRNPQHVEVAGQLALLLLGRNQGNEASEVLKPIAINDKTPPIVWEALAAAAEAAEDWDQAEVALQYLAQSHPFRRDFTYRLGQAQQKQQKTLAADAAFQRSEHLSELHAAVEATGVLLSRNLLDSTHVAKVSRILLQLDLPLEAEEWARIAQAGAGPNAAEYSELVAECQQKRLNQPPTVSLKPWEHWKPWGSSTELPLPQLSATSSAGSLQLTDDSQSMGVNFQYENGHTGKKYLVEAMGGSVAAIDFDRDGWCDLYCPQGGTLGDGPRLEPLSDQLFRNRGDAKFGNVTTSSGIQELRYSQGCAVGDIDNDGFDDLVIANVGPNTMYLNNGDGTFDDISHWADFAGDESLSSSVAFADLDSDGDLDLYVVSYVDGLKICRDDRSQISTCNPNSHQGAADQLYENDGAGGFRNVTASAGVTAPNGKGLGIVVAHLDEDQQPDVFITNDTTPNFLYRNVSQAGKLELNERGIRSGVAFNASGVAEAGMGIAHGDFNHDGKLDLYVTNFLREANTLLLQSEGGTFEDVTAQSHLFEPTLPFLGFGAQAIDFDGDGWQELFVANGHIDDLLDKGDPWKMRPQVFRTMNGKQWSEILPTDSGYLAGEYLGRAALVWDPDRNGIPDLAVAHQDRPVACVMNRTENSNHWLTISLTGVESNRSAVNAQLLWKFGPLVQRTELCGGDGYYCSNERQLSLGLGDHEVLESLEIIWPNGRSQTFENVQGNAHYVLVEGQLLRTNRQ